MERAASLARVCAVLVSSAYGVLLLSDLGGATPEHFKPWLFLGDIAIAFACLPLLLLRQRLEVKRTSNLAPPIHRATEPSTLLAGATAIPIRW